MRRDPKISEDTGGGGVANRSEGVRTGFFDLGGLFFLLLASAGCFDLLLRLSGVLYLAVTLFLFGRLLLVLDLLFSLILLLLGRLLLQVAHPVLFLSS